jgi:hypothetical protein
MGNRKLCRRVIVASVIATTYAVVCQAGGNHVDACQLISASQAGKILGTKITAKPIDTSAAGPDAASMCNYSGNGIGRGFMLMVGHLKYSDAASEVKRREKQAVADIPPGIPKPSFEGVKNIGDAAYLAKTSTTFQLHVLDHGNVIVVNRNVAASAKAVKQAQQIARVALKQLKHN